MNETPEKKMIAYRDAGTGWLVFSNPARRNAVSYEMWAAMAPILEDYAADPGVRALVVRGDGDKAFVSGADISQFEQQRGTPEAVADYDRVSGRAQSLLAGFPKPTIAMIRGYCIGGGVGVALNCDLRIAADDARFAVPAARLGLGYKYGGIKRLVDVVGPAFAKEIFFTARQFSAQEALAMGLVNRVVPAAALEGYVADYAARIAENAPLTVAAAKLAIDRAGADEAGKDTTEVDRAVDACFRSEDYIEGRRAFMEKRKPAFRGR